LFLAAGGEQGVRPESRENFSHFVTWKKERVFPWAPFFFGKWGKNRRVFAAESPAQKENSLARYKRERGRRSNFVQNGRALSPCEKKQTEPSTHLSRRKKGGVSYTHHTIGGGREALSLIHGKKRGERIQSVHKRPPSPVGKKKREGIVSHREKARKGYARIKESEEGGEPGGLIFRSSSFFGKKRGGVTVFVRKKVPKARP